MRGCRELNLATCKNCPGKVFRKRIGLALHQNKTRCGEKKKIYYQTNLKTLHGAGPIIIHHQNTQRASSTEQRNHTIHHRPVGESSTHLRPAIGIIHTNVRHIHTPHFTQTNFPKDHIRRSEDHHVNLAPPNKRYSLCPW